MKYLFKTSKITTVAFVLSIITSQVQAEWSSLSTDERLTRLEKVLQTQTASIEKLRNELQELRGKLEMQANTLENIGTQEVAVKPTVTDNNVPAEEVTGETPLIPPNASEETVSATGSEIDTYNQAFEQLKTGQYADAIKGFRAQLTTYPQGQYAGNAQYWLGESYYVTRDFDSAILAFTQVLEQYPKSNKVAGATLKLGFIYHERGQAPKAIELLEKVVADFPNSTEAKLAQQRLGLLVR